MRILVALLIFVSGGALAQTNDSISNAAAILTSDSTQIDSLSKSKAKVHSPLKAVLFSAALPGLGQAYNKKYWKIPIIYVGLGVGSYFLYAQNKKYQLFRKAYQMKVDGDPLTDGRYGRYTSEFELEQGKNYHRRNVDLISALLAVWYGLNLVDAAVDGHLFHFDVSDNLSMELSPEIKQFQAYNRSMTSFGIQLKLHL